MQTTLVGQIGAEILDIEVEHILRGDTLMLSSTFTQFPLIVTNLSWSTVAFEVRLSWIVGFIKLDLLIVAHGFLIPSRWIVGK